MQAGTERNWNQEQHPAYRHSIPWHTNESTGSALLAQPMKDLPLFQTTMMNTSNAYNPSGRQMFSELPAAATYLPNTSYNKSSQSSSATKYGSHVRKIQNLLQEMEQDEERRLAQIRSDSQLLLKPYPGQQSVLSSNSDKRGLLSLPFDRTESLGRRKSSPAMNNAWAHELQGQDYRKSFLSKNRPLELDVPYETRHKTEDTRWATTQAIELEVPDSTLTDNVAELDVPYNPAQPYERSQTYTGRRVSVDEDPMSSFADVDMMISNSRRIYNSRSSQDSGRNTSASSNTRHGHRSSRSLFVELDASPLNLVAELPGEMQLQSPIEQRSTPSAMYGDKKFRTLPGEAYPLIERASTPRTETGPKRQSPTLPNSKNAGHFIQPNIDPRSGLPYPGA